MGKAVIIVGAGLAGMMAAHAALEEGAEVILIDRGRVGLGTNTALAGGGFYGPMSQYSPEQFVKDTLQIGRMINHTPTVELVARHALDAIKLLRSMGVNLVETPNNYEVKPEGSGIIPGLILVKRISERIESLSNLHLITGFYVTEIINEGDHACGVRGFDKDGKERAFYAPATVLAAGGAGAIYLKNDNQKNMTGQGYYLAARAGLDLWDMEFVQFYPLVLAEPHLPSMLVYPPYAKEIKLVNPAGEDVLKKYGIGDVNEGIMKKRDQFSSFLFQEMSSNPVYMDFRDVPAPSWEKYPLSLLAKLKFDFRAKPVLVTPAAHFFMGGVRTDGTGHTTLQGLFACGEVAWGMHGANRRGGNALTECAVMGRIAGQSAARHAVSQREGTGAVSASGAPASSDVRMPPSSLDSHKEDKPLTRLRNHIRVVAWEKTGILRSEEGLKEGLRAIEDIDRQLRAVVPATVSERKLKQDLMSACFVLRATIAASLGRKESRGSFQRKDYPYEDNSDWLKNSRLSYNPEQRSFALTHFPVNGNT